MDPGLEAQGQKGRTEMSGSQECTYAGPRREAGVEDKAGGNSLYSGHLQMGKLHPEAEHKR